MGKSIYEIADEHIELLDKLTYPDRPKKPQRKDYATNQDYGAATDEYEVTFENFRTALKQHKDQEQEIIKHFKKELLSALGISKHSKAEQLWNMAWEDGHAFGLHEVALCAEKYVSLLK